MPFGCKGSPHCTSIAVELCDQRKMEKSGEGIRWHVWEADTKREGEREREKERESERKREPLDGILGCVGSDGRGRAR